MENKSTLERLLRIQGNPKQITIEAAMEETRDPEPPTPPPVQTTGNQRGKISPAEREAWSVLYRFYEKYAPQMREAACMNDENKNAVEVFRAASVEMNRIYHEQGLIGHTLAVSLYELLELIFKEAKAQTS